MRANTPADFWAQVQKGPADACWPWTGTRFADGRYGRWHMQGVSWLSHRFAWTQVNGVIGEGLCVCHTCDNPPCCNPAHMFLGTQADNAADMVRKGRSLHLHGELNHTRKLTEGWVRCIRALRTEGLSLPAIACEVPNASKANASMIVNRKTWTHI